LNIKLREAAKQFEIPNKVAIFFLEIHNIPVKSHASAINAEQLELLRELGNNKFEKNRLIKEFENKKDVKQHNKNDEKIFLTKINNIDIRSANKKLSEKNVDLLIKNMNFFESKKNKNGNFVNDFISETINKDNVVIDRVTNLMWHQSGSSNKMSFSDSKEWIKEQNSKQYAGYSDWRLPTLEESLSIIGNFIHDVNNLYIDKMFSQKQSSIWTGDSLDIFSSSRMWVVSYSIGNVFWTFNVNNQYVRPVRIDYSTKNENNDSKILKKSVDFDDEIIEIQKVVKPELSIDNIKFEVDFDIERNKKKPKKQPRKSQKIIKREKKKLYFNNGKLMYDGEIINGKLDGYGKQYYKNGNLKYEGEFDDGERNGSGKQFFNNGLIEYEGGYKRSKLDGYGKQYYKNGNLKYEGEFDDGERNGRGKQFFDNGLIEYEGGYNKRGKWFGKGKQYYRNGVLEYDGSFSADYKNGNGKLYYKNGAIEYDGRFQDNSKNGKGKLYYKNGILKYEGGFIHNSFNGNGKLYYKNGTLKYEGLFNSGMTENFLAVVTGYLFILVIIVGTIYMFFFNN